MAPSFHIRDCHNVINRPRRQRGLSGLPALQIRCIPSNKSFLPASHPGPPSVGIRSVRGDTQNASRSSSGIKLLLTASRSTLPCTTSSRIIYLYQLIWPVRHRATHLLCFLFILILSACAGHPKPDLLTSDFESVSGKTVILLPSADRRPAAEKAADPRAMDFLSDLVDAKDFASDQLPKAFDRNRHVNIVLATDEARYRQLLDPAVGSAPSPVPTFFMQFSLLSYDAAPPIKYSMTCAARLALVKDRRETSVWGHQYSESVSPMSNGLLGAILSPVFRNDMFRDCVRRLISTLPELSEKH